MDLRFRIAIIILLTGLVAAVWAFPLWYPLLETGAVTERFPGLETEAQPEFILLPEDVQQAYLDLLEEEDIAEGLPLTLVRARLLGEDQPAPEADQPFEPPSDTVLRSGEFTRISPIRFAEGEITIYQRTDTTRLLRFDQSFRCIRAPGIHVILTRNPDPLDERGVGVDYIDLGELKGNVGGQSYEVPVDIDFNAYPILALYMPEYDFVVSTVTLR